MCLAVQGSGHPGQDGKAGRGGWESDVVGPGRDMGWRRREWGDGERGRERRRIPESKGLSLSDTKPFLASKCGASCGGGPGALGPAKFRVYGHGRPWGPGASASPGGSFQLHGLEGALA